MTNVVKLLTDQSVDINEGQGVNQYWTESDRISGHIIRDIARKTVNMKVSRTEKMTHLGHKIK